MGTLNSEIDSSTNYGRYILSAPFGSVKRVLHSVVAENEVSITSDIQYRPSHDSFPLQLPIC